VNKPADDSPDIRNPEKPGRLHYLDWLQVLAVLGVYLFHAFHPFDDLFYWHIKNDQPSILIDFFVGFFGPWGMSFFFLMAGMTSWFSLRRRPPSQYIRERFTRLLIPFLIGSIILTPVQAYFEFNHNELWNTGSFFSFLFDSEARVFFLTDFHALRIGPTIFGALGYHLWFVGFLFMFSLIALPVFLWIKGETGKRILSWIMRLTAWRGGLLVFVIPPFLARIFLNPIFPGEHDWADFVYMFLFFISGYVLISDKDLMKNIRRDWLLYLALGIVCTLFFFSSSVGVPIMTWLGSPGTMAFYLSWAAFSINGWCWAMFMIYIGMRYLNSTSKWLEYGREASYPFFFIHQPIIIFVAFFSVQWDINILVKILVVVIGSFVLSIGLYEIFIRRINLVRVMFGLKQKKG